MTALEASVGMVANFGPLTHQQLCGITGWSSDLAKAATYHARCHGHLRFQNINGVRHLVLNRPVCIPPSTLEKTHVPSP